MPFFGLLIYGRLADIKGRQTAFKISWRIFTFGIMVFSFTQAKFLKSFGYFVASVHCLPSMVLLFILFFEQNISKEKNRRSLLILACLFVGPLTCSFFSELIFEIDNRYVLGILCAFPAFILSFFTSRIYDSPVFIYPYNKEMAFGLLNRLAKENKKPPIMIDLSKSFWRKIQMPKTDIISLFKYKKINVKLIVGAFSFFTAIFNIKAAQISLDEFTATSVRSVLVNVTTTIADITLCLVLPQLKTRTTKYMSILSLVALGSFLAFSHFWDNHPQEKPITIVHAVVIRYLNELNYGLLLLWSIECFPTVCRSLSVSMVFCGWPLACLSAYLLRDHIQIAGIIGLCMSGIAFVLERYLNINRFGVMKDMINGEYYDQYDEYFKN